MNLRQPKVRFFCIGMVVSSLSWIFIFLLYASISPPYNDTSGESSHRRMSNSIRSQVPADHPRRDVYTANAQSNRPAARQRLAKNDAAERGGVITEGQYDNPFEAGKVETEAAQLLYNQGKRRHTFNEYLSSRLNFHRAVPDTRDGRCTSERYPLPTLPKASVIICFYNEAVSALLRSVHSVLDRSPASLIEEIILVDDSSDDAVLGAPLARYLEQQTSQLVTITRNTKREGLIRSRMIGARQARAKILVFLDSHVEVNEGWLEPLLYRLSRTSSSVVSPIIDIIDQDTFEYKASPPVRGGFTWSMRFSWESIPADLLTDGSNLYIDSPTMAGGLFAVNNEYFFQLGGYDEGMDIWGGENLEMSFRTWMCGGRLEVALCSRVGHVFRNLRPYSSPTGEDTMARNTLRMVHVWLGDSIERFYETSKNRFENVNYGDISDRMALRDRLTCKDFQWYLNNVFDPLSKRSGAQTRGKNEVARLPKDSPTNKGRLIHGKSQLCVLPYPVDKVLSSSALKLTTCSESNLLWYEMTSGAWMISKKFCLDVVKSSPTIKKCTSLGGTQQWSLIPRQGAQATDGLLMYNVGVGLCLYARTPAISGSRLDMSTCDKALLFDYISSQS